MNRTVKFTVNARGITWQFTVKYTVRCPYKKSRNEENQGFQGLKYASPDDEAERRLKALKNKDFGL